MKYLKIFESNESNDVTIVSTSSTWVGIYFNSELKDEGRYNVLFMDTFCRILKKIGHNIEYINIGEEMWKDDFGQLLPKNLETVKLKFNAKRYNI
jgi:hypothetical protein